MRRFLDTALFCILLYSAFLLLAGCHAWPDCSPRGDCTPHGRLD